MQEAATHDHAPDSLQAQRFLTRLETMSPDGRQAFRRIYELAPKGRQQPGSASSGPHVRLAMMEALLHADIAYWVRMNLALRVARKFAQTAGLHEKAQRLSALLEDFHVATEAFIYQIPVETASALRRHRALGHPVASPDEPIARPVDPGSSGPTGPHSGIQTAHHTGLRPCHPKKSHKKRINTREIRSEKATVYKPT